jgi:ubiE/COQ5 methyltransferase family
MEGAPRWRGRRPMSPGRPSASGRSRTRRPHGSIARWASGSGCCSATAANGPAGRPRVRSWRSQSERAATCPTTTRESVSPPSSSVLKCWQSPRSGPGSWASRLICASAMPRHWNSPIAASTPWVITFSLWTIPDDRHAAREAYRVLRPGGRLVLLEHVRSPALPVRLAQRLLDPLAVRFEADHLVREPLDYLEDVGFENQRVERLKWGIVERVAACKPDGGSWRATARSARRNRT